MTTRILFLTFFCWMAFSAKAQLEFAPVGAEWIFTPILDDSQSSNPLASWVSFKCTGDSIIDGQSYRKVGHNLLFLQEGGEIYLRFKDSLYLVFDFEAEVGDALDLFIPVNVGLAKVFEQTEMYLWHFVVDSIELLPTNGQPLKRFFLESSNPVWTGITGYSYQYVENVGDLNWFIGQPGINNSSVPSWLRCYRDSTLEFHSPQLLSLGTTDCFDTTTSVSLTLPPGISIAPNPVTDMLSFDLGPLKISQITFVDLRGRIVYQKSGEQSGMIQIDSGSWPKGVYLCHAQYGANSLVLKIVK